MGDRALTAEEQAVLERAAAIVRESMGRQLMARVNPMKVDCIEMRCHPDDERDVRAVYDAPIVVDPAQERGTLSVVPYAYAKHITTEIGFAQRPAAPGREQG